jgi:hypothetical protein
MKQWQKVGAVPTTDLTEARLQLHWASQLGAAVGIALVPSRADDSHTALTSIPERSMLVTGETDGDSPRRVALSLPDFRIVVVDEELKETDGLPLDGQTLSTGLDWLRAKLSSAELALPTYDVPPHAIKDGEAFRQQSPNGFAELAAWFYNGAHVLTDLDLGDVICWPHHFDIASLITLDGDKTIGIGLSPGDSSYDEPYWYVTPWPYPTSADRPALPSGHWHSEGFVAAILTGSDITASDDAASQRATVDAFLEAAIDGSRKLLA